MVISVGDFCEVVDSELSYYGIKKGDLAYMAGSSDQPTEDPYTFRRKFIAAKVVDGHVDNESKPYFVDPVRLKKLSLAKQEKYQAIYDEDFKLPEEASNDE